MASTGRAPGSVQLIVPLFTAAGDTEEERARWREVARMQVAFYGSTPNYAFMFEMLDRPGTTQAIRERQKAGDTKGMAAVIDDDLLAHFMVESSYDGLADAVIDRLGGIADRVVLYMAGMTYRADREGFARLGAAAREVVERTS